MPPLVMLILAIDTALEACSVGIGRDGAPDVASSEIIGRGHGERLFGMVRETMDHAGISFADIDRFAVTVGPGSFTGIRVGIAAVRGFALVTRRPAAGVTTLAAHAETGRSAGAGTAVLAVLEARAGTFYAQLFDVAGAPLTLPQVATAEHLAAIATEAGASLAGSGAPAVAAIGGARVLHARSAPDIASVLRLAQAAPSEPAPPRPLYLGAPDATPSPAAVLPRR